MKGFHKKYTLHCEALSPIHIGSGEALSRWEYVIIGNELYYTTDEFWELLRNTDIEIFNKLVTSISHSDTASLTEKFQSLPNKALLQQTLKKSDIEFKSLKDKNKKPIIRNIHHFAGAPNYYIPGSSIKGALRGAYEVMKIDEEFFQKHAERERFFLDSFSDNDMQKLYNTIGIRLKEYSGLDSQISENFQGIIVRDIHTSTNNFKIVPVTFTTEENDKNTADLYECLKAGEKFKIEINYKTQNPDSKFFKISFLDLAFNFYRDNFEELHLNSPILSDYYNNAEDTIKQRERETKRKVYLLRCGYGSGQICNSVLSLWKKYSSMPGKDKILWQGKSQKLLKEGRFKNLDDYYYPSAPKRDISDMNEHTPLGWIMINSIECNN